MFPATLVAATHCISYCHTELSTESLWNDCTWLRVARQCKHEICMLQMSTTTHSAAHSDHLHALQTRFKQRLGKQRVTTFSWQADHGTMTHPPLRTDTVGWDVALVCQYGRWSGSVDRPCTVKKWRPPPLPILSLFKHAQALQTAFWEVAEIFANEGCRDLAEFRRDVWKRFGNNSHSKLLCRMCVAIRTHNPPPGTARENGSWSSGRADLYLGLGKQQTLHYPCSQEASRPLQEHLELNIRENMSLFRHEALPKKPQKWIAESVVSPTSAILHTFPRTQFHGKTSCL